MSQSLGLDEASLLISLEDVGCAESVVELLPQTPTIGGADDGPRRRG